MRAMRLAGTTRFAQTAAARTRRYLRRPAQRYAARFPFALAGVNLAWHSDITVISTGLSNQDRGWKQILRRVVMKRANRRSPE